MPKQPYCSTCVKPFYKIFYFETLGVFILNMLTDSCEARRIRNVGASVIPLPRTPITLRRRTGVADRIISGEGTRAASRNIGPELQTGSRAKRAGVFSGPLPTVFPSLCRTLRCILRQSGACYLKTCTSLGIFFRSKRNKKKAFRFRNAFYNACMQVILPATRIPPRSPRDFRSVRQW